MIRRGLFAFLAALAVASPVFAGPKYACDTLDPAVVAANEAAGSELASACVCADATRPSEHKRCVAAVLNARVRANLLSKGCARLVKIAYIPSVCGYPAGAVACARRARGFGGLPQCRIVPNEDACTPPARGGVVCQSVTCYEAIGAVYNPTGPYSDCRTLTP